MIPTPTRRIFTCFTFNYSESSSMSQMTIKAPAQEHAVSRAQLPF